jgi:hypothetical protein
MREATPNENETPDYASMSDEEIANVVDLPPLVAQVEEEASYLEEDLDDDTPAADEEDKEAVEDNDQELDTDEESKEEEDETDDSDADAEGDPEVDSEDEDQTDDSDSDEEAEDSTSVAEAQLKELFSPFKANGRMMAVNNIADAMTLMQKGANYNKKMASVKPHLKTIKVLEKNGLLDESQLNLAIEVMQGKPEAIAKLIQDKNLDVLTLNSATEDYVPDAYTVSDEEINLDSALDDIKTSSAYAETLDIISNKLDEPSRKVLLASPEGIKLINEHVESGLYEEIMTIVDQERTLGRLTGLSDLDAYKATGLRLQEAGAFGDPSGKPKARPTSNEVANTKAKAKKDAARKSKKKAAASPTASPGKQKIADDFDILNMSDEELEQFGKEHGLPR